jgi:uncharacterized protein (UPF0332 family)
MISPDAQTLLNQARENVRAAKLLLHAGFNSIAASRAYYAMFYTAEALMLAHRNQSFSSHSALIAAFGREFAKTRLLDPRFHSYLIAAQKLRQSSDYGISATVTTDETAQALQWAQELITAAETFLAQT